MNRNVLGPEGVLDFPLDGVSLIEASAGTGKTYTIANLHLLHVLAGRMVGDVLVVTFTNAATDELRGRIRARLFEALAALQQDAPGRDAFLAAWCARIGTSAERDPAVRRLRLALRSMDTAPIYTIHSFCQRALSEFAFNSGQQFQMELLTDDRELWRQAVQDWWRKTAYPLSGIRLRWFTDATGGLASFRTLLAPLLAAQRKTLLPKVDSLEQELSALDAMGPDSKSIAARWLAKGERERLEEILLRSPRLRRIKKGPYHADKLPDALLKLDQYFHAVEAQPAPKEFELLTPRCMQAYAKSKDDPALDDDFFARCGALWESLQRGRRRLRVAALAAAADFARQAVREAKRKAQLLSYDDLLNEMHAALQADNAEALARSIRERFPVAMIDEFQDTDPIQYGIFRRLYHQQADCSLVMIGDPKQAIYGFRGGDIFTYMRAREDVGAERIYTLNTNWRATPELVNAVNAVFSQREKNAFVYGDTIPFTKASAAPKKHRCLTRDGVPQSALTLWTLPVKQNGKGEEVGLAKKTVHQITHEAVAGEIAQLIAAGRAGKARLGDAPLRPADIAVLVREYREARELRQALSSYGVQAVLVGNESVFTCAQAAALEVLLQAVINPRDAALARMALACPLLGKSLVEIDQIIHDEAGWLDWLDDLQGYHERWQRSGFMAMLQHLLRTMGIAAAVGRGDAAQRALTNVLHLGELLQRASRAHTGMDALLAWYQAQRQQATAADETKLRLESDEELVQIVTVHSSKGLQYPVVFAPYLWHCKPCHAGEAKLLAYHADARACLYADAAADSAQLFLADAERLAEDVRLTYVALTRAESALYLVWGRAGSKAGGAGHTALGYLLHPTQPRGQLDTGLADAFAGQPDLQADLRALAAAAAGDIALASLPATTAQPEPQPAARATRPGDLVLQVMQRKIAGDWKISSFSALARDVHASPPSACEPDDDDLAFRFPAGSHVGSYLHLLLEKLDFQQPVEAQVLVHSARIGQRFNIEAGLWHDAAALLQRVLHTSLDGEDLCLATLSAEQRLNELEFDFATGPVHADTLNAVLKKAAHRNLPPLELATFRGMVTGVIDLVFEYQGRFFIVDYKSNRLGGRFSDYTADRLADAVYQHRYDLQYLLYTLALHRYLGARLRDYDYQRHFGGVYYLFLRGMREPSGPSRGVYRQRPDFSLIDALDRKVFGRAREDAA